MVAWGVCLLVKKQDVKASSVYPGLGLLPQVKVMTNTFKSLHLEYVSSVQYGRQLLNPQKPFQCKLPNSDSLMLDGDYFLHSVTVLQQDNLTS